MLRSHGSILAFLSADDTVEPNYLSNTASMLSGSGGDIVYTDLRLFGGECRYISFRDCAINSIGRNNFIHGGALFRRNVFEVVGGFDPALDKLGFEDWDFWLSAFEHGFAAVYAADTSYNWRRHASSRHKMALARDLSARRYIERKHRGLVEREPRRRVIAWHARSALSHSRLGSVVRRLK